VEETGFPSRNHTQFASSSVDSDQDVDVRENRPLSALIAILGGFGNLSRESFGNPGYNPDFALPIKPQIMARIAGLAQIYSGQAGDPGKRGYVSTIARRKSGSSPSSPNDPAFHQTNEGLTPLVNSIPCVRSSVRPVTFRESYSRLKPGLSQATIRYPIEDTEFWDMD